MSEPRHRGAYGVEIVVNKMLVYRALVFEDSWQKASASGIAQYRAWRKSLKCNAPAYITASVSHHDPALSVKFGPLKEEAYEETTPEFKTM